MLHPMEHHLFIKPGLCLDGVHSTLGMCGQLARVDRPPPHALVDNEGGEEVASGCNRQCNGAALALVGPLSHVDGSLATILRVVLGDEP